MEGDFPGLSRELGHECRIADMHFVREPLDMKLGRNTTCLLFAFRFTSWRYNSIDLLSCTTATDSTQRRCEKPTI